MSKVIRRDKSLIAFALTATVGVGFVSNSAYVNAGNSEQQINLGTNVNANCKLQNPVAVAFGDYDPVVTNATAPLDANGSFQIKCNKGDVGIISIGPGLNQAGINRRMKQTLSANFLNYNLYTTVARSTIWNTSNTVSYTAPNGSATTLTVFGRVGGGQINAVAGSYTDTVVVTVTY